MHNGSWNDGMSGGNWWWMALMMVAFWGGIILLAVTFVAGVPSFTKALFGVDEFAWFPAMGGWLSLGAFAAIGWVLIRMARKET